MTSSDTNDLVRDIRKLACDTFSISHSFQDTKEKISEVIGLVQGVPEIPLSDHTRAKELAEEWSKHAEVQGLVEWRPSILNNSSYFIRRIPHLFGTQGGSQGMLKLRSKVSSQPSHEISGCRVLTFRRFHTGCHDFHTERRCQLRRQVF